MDLLIPVYLYIDYLIFQMEFYKDTLVFYQQLIFFLIHN
jgi:hypothetical protein